MATSRWAYYRFAAVGDTVCYFTSNSLLQLSKSITDVLCSLSEHSLLCLSPSIQQGSGVALYKFPYNESGRISAARRFNALLTLV